MFLSRLIAAVVDAPARTRRAARVRALIDEGSTLVAAGRAQEAAKRYARALEIEPRAAGAHARLALLYTGLKRVPEALPHFRAAHAASALAGESLRWYVQALLARGAHEEAERVARESSRAHGDAASRFCLGLAHAANHRYGDALEAYRDALSFEADADIHTHCGIALQYLGRLDEAEAEYSRALALAPGYPPAAFHRSLTLLARGRYAEGWPEYEARLASADAPVRPRRYPRWDGSPAAGRTILIYGEQGLGDEIMFASCIGELTRGGARCVLECDPRLAGLFARSFPEALVYTATPDKRVPDKIDAEGIDAEVPIGSLPLYFRGRREDFPAKAAYLTAEPRRVSAWRERLGALGPGMTVGLSWSGGTQASRRPLRSIPLETLLPLLGLPGVRFVSLQYGEEPTALAAFCATHGVMIAHWPEAIADYDETAALVTALDLTLSVCTSVVHLAGALARPVWVMAPAAPEWRYGVRDESMDWYPTARLYRRRDGDGWEPVVAAVARALQAAAGAASTPAAMSDAAHAANSEGTALLRARDFAAAQGAFERALALAPALAEARVNLAIALIEQGRQAEGESHLRAAIAAAPQLISARENLAVLLATRFEHAAALAAWDDVLALAPEHAGAHAAKAHLAVREGRFDEARRCHARALELGADPASVALDEANMRTCEGDAAGARAVIEGLRGSIDEADLDWALALSALTAGEFGHGWDLYEARLARTVESPRRPYPYPAWDGTPVTDGSLLIMAEQGVGDEIMFASCYGEAIARARHCVIECEPRLARLLARSFPTATLVPQPRGAASAAILERTDVHCQVHAGSLPRLFRRRTADFPSHDGYLEADTAAVRAWRARLAGNGGKRLVGIAWSGGLVHTRRGVRSVPPQAFARALALPHVELVSLQHDDDGSAAAGIAAHAGRPVHVFREALADFDAMAALVKACDCVVTVCSSVVHLSGALGVPVIVLTPKAAEWRYLSGGTAMPWYPSVRLMRQRVSGEWSDVVDEAHSELERIAAP